MKFAPSCSSKNRMIDRWEISKLLVISTEVDRFAGILVVIGKILPITYGIRTETERLRVLVWVIPEINLKHRVRNVNLGSLVAWEYAKFSGGVPSTENVKKEEYNRKYSRTL